MSKFRLPHALVALSLPILACGVSEGTSGEGSGTSPNTPSSPLSVSVAHRDERLGVPTFAWVRRNDVARFDNAAQAAMATVRGLGGAFGLKAAAIATLGEPELDVAGTGTIVARFQQRVAGVEVFRANMNVAMRRDFAPIAVSGLVMPTLSGSERAFVRDATEALATALHNVPGAPATASATEAQDEYLRFTAPGLAQPARVKRVYFPGPNAAGANALEPAHYVEVMVRRGAARSFVVSAVDGRILFENDLVRHDAYSYRVYADSESLVPMDGPQGNGMNPHPTGKPDRQKLAWVPQQLVTLANAPFSKNDPWLPPGATTTEGNNVRAYADIADPDGLAAGDVSNAPTAASVFDHSYDTAASPGSTSASIQSSITQLFYVTNFLHDWFYDAGFDEKAGNHQKSNLTRGGKQNDPLLAEAQDSSGRNNADATVPADGASPRIQMYIFGGTSEAELTVTSPASIAGKKPVGVSGGFGKDLFDITGQVVLGVDDGGADANDGCESLSPVTGKIVLLHRGTCSFAQKTQNAEAAGAIGALIVNVASSTSPTVPPFMGGTQANIKIPVLSLALADGQALEGALAENPSVTMKRTGGVDVDGALDTTIVAHEWGHVLSGRLVGNGNGLTTNQAGGLGEGWGDFTSLLLIARADDPAAFDGAYTNGSYAMSGAGDDIYFGTRRVPYSTDLAKNPLTFKHIQNGVALPAGPSISFGEEGNSNAEVHNTGEVWATMLWECYTSLLRDKRFTFKEAQERMKRYLIASLKLTPVDPTLLEARDAMLAAAYANDERDALLFWQAFARRGAGAGAEGPSKISATNIGVKESFSAGSAALVQAAVLRDDQITCDRDGILDEGEVGTIELTVKNAGSGTLAQLTARLSSKTPGVSLLDPTPVPVQSIKMFEANTFKLTTQLRAAKPVDVVDVDVTFSDPTFAQDQTVSVTIPARYQADEAAESAAVDNVETKTHAWKIAGATTTVKWAREEEGSNHFWSIPNAVASGDHRLISPAFTIPENVFSLSFRHRHSFRFSTRRGTDQDGGVVEITIDGGKTWVDISTYGKIDYNTTLDSQSRGENPLKGRKAYGNKSAGYPEKWLTSRVDVALPSRPDAVQIRFRSGFGDAFSTTAEGWDIDDVELVGASSQPFWAFVPHRDQCDPNAPTVNAGPAKTGLTRETIKLEGSGSAPSEEPLTFLWRQVAGAPVVLRDETTPTPSFEAPEVPGALRFELRAHDGKLLSPAAAVDVTIGPAGAAPSSDDSGCSCRNTPGSSSGSALSALGFGLAAVAFGIARRRRATG